MLIECKRKRLWEVGFIDPSIVNCKNLERKPGDCEEALLRSLLSQTHAADILLPYNFK